MKRRKAQGNRIATILGKNWQKKLFLSHFKPAGEFSRPLREFSELLGEFSRPLGEFSELLGEFSRPLREFSESFGEFSRPLREFSKPLGEFSAPRGEPSGNRENRAAV